MAAIAEEIIAYATSSMGEISLIVWQHLAVLYIVLLLVGWYLYHAACKTNPTAPQWLLVARSVALVVGLGSPATVAVMGHVYPSAPIATLDPDVPTYTGIVIALLASIRIVVLSRANDLRRAAANVDRGVDEDAWPPPPKA